MGCSTGCSTGCTPACPGAICPGAICPRDTGQSRSPCDAGQPAWCIDGSSVRAHKHAAGTGKIQRHRPALSTAPAEPLDHTLDHTLGRSRGGFSTKLHLATDGPRLPLAVELSAGQAHEFTYAAPVLSAVKIPHRQRRRGRPRTRPDMVAGDKGYDITAVRRWLRAHCIQAVIPEKKRLQTSGSST